MESLIANLVQSSTLNFNIFLKFPHSLNSYALYHSATREATRTFNSPENNLAPFQLWGMETMLI